MYETISFWGADDRNSHMAPSAADLRLSHGYPQVWPQVSHVGSKILQEQDQVCDSFNLRVLAIALQMNGNMTSKFTCYMEVWNIFLFSHILGMPSSQLTNLYFSEGWPNHQPACYMDYMGYVHHLLSGMHSWEYRQVDPYETPTGEDSGFSEQHLLQVVVVQFQLDDVNHCKPIQL